MLFRSPAAGWIIFSAPQDGTIASVNVRKGDVVNSGDLLITMN